MAGGRRERRAAHEDAGGGGGWGGVRTRMTGEGSVGGASVLTRVLPRWLQAVLWQVDGIGNCFSACAEESDSVLRAGAAFYAYHFLT